MSRPDTIEQMRADYYARYPDAPRHRGSDPYAGPVDLGRLASDLMLLGAAIGAAALVILLVWSLIARLFA